MYDFIQYISTPLSNEPINIYICKGSYNGLNCIARKTTEIDIMICVSTDDDLIKFFWF